MTNAPDFELAEFFNVLNHSGSEHAWSRR